MPVLGTQTSGVMTAPFAVKSHQRCPHCGRLLVPLASKQLPPHRKPPPRIYGREAVPLTGRDAPWCAGGAS